MKVTSEAFFLSATDLSNHLSCAHLTQLNRLVALGKISKPTWYDPSLQILIQRGQDHEAAYVEHLKKQGLSVINLRGQSQEATISAMRQGIDVIVQARLDNDRWLGYADILLKVPVRSDLGDWSYEVQDTKLAQNTRAATILQLSLYSDLLSLLQGGSPECMHVIKPGENFPGESYRFAEFQAYYKMVKQSFEQTMTQENVATYPDPVSHCSICSWWQVCDRKRHVDDSLSLVAGIRSLHVVELQKQNITTLEKFATTATIAKPDRGNMETFIRKQLQARIQYNGRIENRLIFDCLENEPGRGLNRLPEPNDGDIYFDIEGDAFYESGGLEYLLGYAYKENGNLTYKHIWSSSRAEERNAFGRFMEFLVDRWKRYPKMHVYHFAPYEPTALKRLARVHALFEKEVDDLLRAQRFIDLHAVFKEALLASVETYSLKELERFTKYMRKVKLQDASSARKSVEIALELHEFNAVSNDILRLVQEYNEDDCLATEALHAWLEQLRTTLSLDGKLFQRPPLEFGEATENVQNLDRRSLALYQALTANLPDDKSNLTDVQAAKWLLAHQLDYFRREDKSAWWEYFRVHELEYEDLLDERKAITGLTFLEELPKSGREKNPTHRYGYPPQEVSVEEDDELFEVKGEKVGTVKAISLENHTIDIKKTEKSIGLHPLSVHAKDVIPPGSLETSLMDLATYVDEDGLGHTWPYHASKDLLMRRLPKMRDGKDGAWLLADENIVDGAIRMAKDLDKSYLAIQGPPGAGKTYTGAKMILELAKAGKKIGVTAVSHKVIRNLANATLKLASEQNIEIQFVHKVTEKDGDPTDGIVEVDKSEKAIKALSEGKVVCGTAWLWAEDKSRGVLDYLFVDEAGQMSLSQVLAASRAAENLILLGDPRQLEQPQKGSHPEGSDVAALSYILDGSLTMPEGKGLFLNVTRRMHPKICRFTSEIFYENKLTSLPGLELQMISGGTPFDGAGLFYVPVEHRGNQNKSLEEIETILHIVSMLLENGKYTSAKNQTRRVQKEDILIVAPFNAQVGALREKLPGIQIGTVDKFQGQEAPVVIYSMTSSTAEDAPRGMAFLYNPNRLNVATSRARSTCILVASPMLLQPDCQTIDQMRWANALCRFKELAKSTKHGA
jgi:uncharacterized protein